MRRPNFLALGLVLVVVSSGVITTLGANSAEIVQTLRSRLLDANLSSADLDVIAQKKAVVHSISSSNPKEIAGMGVILADAPPEAFVDSYRTLTVFKNSPKVLELGAFSNPPSIKDLDGLHIDNEDLNAMSKAKVGDSEVKLAESEIRRFQDIASRFQGAREQLKERIAAEFKKIVLERADSYLRNGGAGVSAYADKPEPVSADASFRSLAGEEKQSRMACDHVCTFLEGSAPGGASRGDSAFLYWAKERFGELKSVINVFHVLIHKEGDRFFIASKQVYSSHYTEAALSVAEFIPFRDSGGRQHTIIAYTLRLQADMLGSGPLGFMKKRMASPKILAGLKESLERLQVTLESASAAQSEEVAQN